MFIIAIDPGETVGWSVWNADEYTYVTGGQTPLWPFVDQFGAEMEAPEAWPKIEHVVVEDWAIYPWAAEKHGLDWDKCLTARGIGAIQYICRRLDIPVTLQAAAIKDGGVAAGAENYFVAPRHENRHQNDSMYHAVFWLAQKGAAE